MAYYRIQKGKALEEHIAQRIKDFGIDNSARRSYGSGNSNNIKADIETKMTICGRAAGIEAKNQKALAIPDWWRQTEKLSGLGYEPVLAFKLPHEGLDATKIIIYLDTLLELIKNQCPSQNIHQ